MADAVVKLKVESQEFDNKLARATQQLQHMEKEVRRTGASFEFADKEELAFIQSLGQMETKTQSLRTKMREYTESILSLTEMYERLSDTEKNSDFGRGLLSSIDQIKQRAGELKDNMGDLDAEIKHLASDTSTFDSLAGGVNLMVSAFQVGQGIIQMFGVENENAVKAIAKLQGAMAVTNGLVQLQNALQKESAVMLGVTTLQRKAAAAAAAIEAAAVGKGTVALKAATVAQKALNVASKANPYVLLATAVLGVGAALWKMSKNSQKAKEEQERQNKALEEAEERFNNYNSTIASEVGGIVAAYQKLRIEWEGLSSEQEKTEWIANQKSEFDKLGISINDIVEAENVFVKNSQKMVQALDLRARAAALEKLSASAYEEYYQKIQSEGGLVRAGQAVDAFSANQLYQYDYAWEINSPTKPARPTLRDHVVKGEDGTYYYTESGANAINEERILASEAGFLENNAIEYLKLAQDIREEAEQMFAEMGVKGSEKKVEETVEVKPVLPEGSAAQLQQELADLKKAWSMATTQEERDQLTIDIERVTQKLEQMRGKAVETSTATKKVFTVGSMNDLQNQLKLANDELNNLAPDTQEWADALARVLEIQKEIANIQSKISGDTSNNTQAAETNADAWQSAVSAVGQLGGALQGLEDPSAKVAGIIAQAIANIALTFATSLKGTVTPWDWIAAAISGTATMIGTISAIKSATAGSYADGGIIPGNSFSGDNLTASVNSGELILNRSQQNVIASQLTGNNPMQNLQLSTEISGTNLRIVMNNDNRSKGGSRGYYANIH